MEKRNHRLADISAHRMTRGDFKRERLLALRQLFVFGMSCCSTNALIAPCTLFAKPQLAAPPPTKNHQFSALKSPTRFLNPAHRNLAIILYHFPRTRRGDTHPTGE